MNLITSLSDISSLNRRGGEGGEGEGGGEYRGFTLAKICPSSCCFCFVVTNNSQT